MPHEEAQNPQKFHSTIFIQVSMYFFLFFFFFFQQFVDLGPFGNKMKGPILGNYFPRPFSFFSKFQS